MSAFRYALLFTALVILAVGMIWGFWMGTIYLIPLTTVRE